MRTSEERIQELHRRMEVMNQQEVRRAYLLRCAAACAVCLAGAVAVALLIARVPASGSFYGTGSFSASIFADHGALGYVVTAFVAFCLGTALTIFCFRLKHQQEEKDRSNDRKH